MHLFILNIAERDKKFFDEVKRYPNVQEFLMDPEDTGEGKTYSYYLRRKKKGTCFDEPILPWREVGTGDVLWCEWYENNNLFPTWEPVVVTLKYGGVVFYRKLDKDLKPCSDIKHAALGSIACDRFFYPYIIVLPKGWVLKDCHNPKQIIQYV